MKWTKPESLAWSRAPLCTLSPAQLMALHMYWHRYNPDLTSHMLSQDIRFSELEGNKKSAMKFLKMFNTWAMNIRIRKIIKRWDKESIYSFGIPTSVIVLETVNNLMTRQFWCEARRYGLRKNCSDGYSHWLQLTNSVSGLARRKCPGPWLAKLTTQNPLINTLGC